MQEQIIRGIVKIRQVIAKSGYASLLMTVPIQVAIATGLDLGDRVMVTAEGPGSFRVELETKKEED